MSPSNQGIQTRRRFIHNFSILSLVAAFMPNAFAATSWMAKDRHAARKLKYSKFAAQLNTRFRAMPKLKRGIDLQLIEATNLFTGDAMVGRGYNDEVFSLKFAGPASAPLAQNTYSFSHKNMGSFEMFIVPSGTTGSMIQYQAIFNRINS